MPPTQLLNTLDRLRLRIRALSLAYGASLVVACAIVLLLAAAVLDYVLNLRAIPRLVVLLAVVGVLGWMLLRFVIRPMMARFTLRDVASRIERAFPQFDDRLRSTVDFATGDAPGSEVLKARVMAEAGSLAQQVDLSKALVYKPVWYSTASAAAAIALLVLLMTLLPTTYVTIAVERMFNPFGGALWPKRVNIAMVEAPPQRVPVGQRIPIRMQLTKGDKPSLRATIFYQYEGGPVQRELMTRSRDGTYTASLDARIEPGARQGSVRAWIESGDDRYELQPIVIVPRLQIDRVEAVIAPPPYAPQRSVMFDLASGPAVMTAGSNLQLRVTFNKPLDSESPIELEPVEQIAPPQVTWQIDGDSTAVGTLLAHESLRFRIRARDRDGFSNSALEEFQWIVRPDQQPVVQIEQPRSNIEATPQATVPLQAAVEDDYGIDSLRLIVERLGGEQRWEIDLIANGQPTGDVAWTPIDHAGDRHRFRMNYGWQLATLEGGELKSGDVLQYHLLVRDNFNLDGQRHEPVASGRLRITIISQEEFTNRVADELLTVKQRIAEIKNIQDRTRGETINLRRETSDKDELHPADRAIAERLANQQSTTASQTKQTAQQLRDLQRRMDNNRSEAADLRQMAADVEELLNQTAEGPMKEAANEINAARDQQGGNPQERSQKLDRAADVQQTAADQLSSAMNRMGSIGNLQTTIAQLRNILDRQRELTEQTAAIGRRNLGKTLDQMNPDDRRELQKIADEQQALSEKTQEALDKMEEDARSMDSSDSATAQTMRNASRTGRQQGVPARQRQASQNARQNQQTQAQANQKAAEIGLEMVLGQLREAERRKLEALARKLAEMQELVGNLVRRQAGHNLDNLTLQGGTVLADLDSSVRDRLFELSERSQENPPAPPGLPQLSNAQEQTERNTRDIARQAEEMEDGAQASAHLVRAAGKMERAIVHLRNQELPQAYEPPMVDALAALVDALDRINQQKAQVEQQQENQRKESIRERYIQIRKEQQAINTRTRESEGKRREDGSLDRVTELALTGLSGTQAELAERTAGIEADLSGLGSIVYVWANQDIVKSMNAVKGHLAQARSGNDVQAEQLRIIQQLDVMIDNLKATPPDDPKFASREGGGGGGGGGSSGPRLPSEAELRLLKELQRAVNNATIELDKAENKDPAELVALGERQGDLRTLLDRLLQQASRGQVKLGPEPDNRDQLPEEASDEDIDLSELERELLSGELTEEAIERDTNLIGDRMARSRQRLAINHDPGKTTQKIQERILIDLDQLIEASRRQQQQQQMAGGQSSGQQQRRPSQGQQPQGTQEGTAQRNTSTEAAQESTAPGAAAIPNPPEGDIRETMAEWGSKLPPRLRDAVIEGSSEKIIEKYKALTEDYYRSIATEASRQR